MRFISAVIALGALCFFLSCPTASEGQLLRGRARPLPAYPMPTLPFAESPTEMPCVPQPSSPNSPEESTSSSQQGTALEPVPGTGSRLPIGPLAPNVLHKIDPESLSKLKAMFDQLSAVKPSANITMPLEPATSQRLERISMLLEVLLWLGGAILGTSSAGRALQLVAPAVRGLLSMLAAMQPPPTATLPASTSGQVAASAAVTPAAVSSTKAPVT